MNTDIRLSVGFWQHPKTKKTSRRLGLEGVRSLQVLWAWVAENRPDGNLSGMDWEDIELAADWQGEEQKFYALCLGMWIDETPEGYALHDWQEHNPWVAEAEVRGGQSRMAKLAQVNRDAYDECLRRGIEGLSQEEYQRWKSWRKTQEGESLSESTADSLQPQCDRSATAERSLAKPSAPLPLPSPNPEEKKENTASASPAAAHSPLPSPVGAEEQDPLVDKVKATHGRGKIPPPDGTSYRAKSGRHLVGKRLETFERFWSDFALLKGKAEAADAWLDIAGMTPRLAEQICYAARQEATHRAEDKAKGKSPKWAQGWLTGRRWEEYPMPNTAAGTSAEVSVHTSQIFPDPTPEELERNRLEGIKKMAEWRERQERIRGTGPVTANFGVVLGGMAQ